MGLAGATEVGASGRVRVGVPVVTGGVEGIGRARVGAAEVTGACKYTGDV